MGFLRGWLQGATGAGHCAHLRRAEAQHQRALEAWHDGDWRSALELAENALEHNAESADIHYLVGACHFKAEQYETAAASFNQAARFAKGHPLALRSELYAALSECRCGRGSRDLPPAPAPRRFPMVSIIICSVDDNRFDQVAADYHRLCAGLEHEIVRIDDARSLAEGYNRGIDRAKGELLLFSHDDIRIVSPDFVARCIAHLEHCELLGIAGSAVLSGGSWINAGWPHLAGQAGMDDAEPGVIAVTVYGTGPALVGGMQALDGVLLCMRRALAEELRFDQETFDGWHLYDIDFSFRAALAGHRVAAANDLLVVHASKGSFGAEWKRYERRFVKKFEGELLAVGTSQQQERCSVTLRSEQEWRALSATRLARYAARTHLDAVSSATRAPERHETALPARPAVRHAGSEADPAEALYQRAAAAFSTDNWEQAATITAQALSLEPALPALHYLLGCCRLAQDEHAAALQSFARCLELQPKYPLSAETRARQALCRARIDLAQGKTAAIEPLAMQWAQPVSVLICSRNARLSTQAEAMYHRLLDEVPHEIIFIRDARSLAEGYNRALRQARNDIVVFAHDDIGILSPDFAARLLRGMSRHDLVGIAGTRKLAGGAWHFAGDPHLAGQVGVPGDDGGYLVTLYDVVERETKGLQALDGLLLATRRDTALRLGFDETAFDGWQLYDLDFSLRAAQAGLDCATCNDILVVHEFQANYDEHWRKYAQRFVDKHASRLGPMPVELARPELVALQLHSAEEWRLLTQQLIECDG